MAWKPGSWISDATVWGWRVLLLSLQDSSNSSHHNARKSPSKLTVSPPESVLFAIGHPWTVSAFPAIFPLAVVSFIRCTLMISSEILVDRYSPWLPWKSLPKEPRTQRPCREPEMLSLQAWLLGSCGEPCQPQATARLETDTILIGEVCKGEVPHDIND